MKTLGRKINGRRRKRGATGHSSRNRHVVTRARKLTRLRRRNRIAELPFGSTAFLFMVSVEVIVTLLSFTGRCGVAEPSSAHAGAATPTKASSIVAATTANAASRLFPVFMLYPSSRAHALNKTRLRAYRFDLRSTLITLPLICERAIGPYRRLSCPPSRKSASTKSSSVPRCTG